MQKAFVFRLSPKLAVLLTVAALAPTIFAAKALALTFREVEYTCPIDGKVFKTRVVASYTQFGMRLDLRPVGALVAPIPLPVCPDNGFVMYKKTFSDAELAKLKPVVLGEDYRRKREANTSYYMVAYLRERMGAQDYELAQLYLKASWQAEGRKELHLLEQYRSLALQRFDAFVNKSTDRSPQWWSAAVVAAELERLLGRFDNAEARLNKLPVAQLDAKSVLPRVIEQIRSHAKNHDKAPARFVSK
jgi:hypothetical protein